MMRAFSTAMLVGALVAAAPRALAQGAPAGEGLKLYEEAKVALQDKDLAKACALFDKSYSLSGSAGALLSWADCEEQRGRLAKAHELWAQGEALLARDPERAEFARTRRAALDPRLGRIEIHVPDGVEATVSLDGVEVRAGAHRVDPGDHVVEGRSRGAATARQAVHVGAGEATTVELFHDLHRPKEEPPPPLVRAPNEPVAGPGTSRVADPGTSRVAVAGWVVGGVGALSLVGFAVTGGVMLGQCGSLSECEASSSTVEPLGIANAVLLGVGAAALATGVVLLVVDAKRARPTSTALQLSAGAAGPRLGFRRSF